MKQFINPLNLIRTFYVIYCKSLESLKMTQNWAKFRRFVLWHVEWPLVAPKYNSQQNGEWITYCIWKIEEKRERKNVWSSRSSMDGLVGLVGHCPRSVKVVLFQFKRSCKSEKVNELTTFRWQKVLYVLLLSLNRLIDSGSYKLLALLCDPFKKIDYWTRQKKINCSSNFPRSNKYNIRRWFEPKVVELFDQLEY